MSVSFLWLLPKCAQTAIDIDKIDAKEPILQLWQSNAEKGFKGAETFGTFNDGWEVAKPYEEERFQPPTGSIEFGRDTGADRGIVFRFLD